MIDTIKIRGARVHNLKNIDLDIPKNQLVVVTGLSGSGKSSLAFDAIYAEGQRRYAESMSSYARQFMETRDKPDVDSMEGLSATIAIDQRVSTQNPRSTVGTITEIYDFLRLLYARGGEQFCSDCHLSVRAFTPGEIAEKLRTLARKYSEIAVVAPLVVHQKVEPKELIAQIERSGFENVRIGAENIKLTELARYPFASDEVYDIGLVVGKIFDIKKQDPMSLVVTALDLSNGLVQLVTEDKIEVFSTYGLCPRCNRKFDTLDIRSFSFNSPYGACSRCTGLGVTMEVDPSLVIPNPRLTLAEGAIQPWTRVMGSYSGYQKILSAVAEKHEFELNVPVSQLSRQVLDLILYGTGSLEYGVDGKKTVFSGVIPDLMNKHLSTNSDYVRKEIEQYMREKICSLCQGKRLRKESLSVFIGGFSIADVASKSIEEIKDLLMGSMKTTQKVVAPIIKEIIPRLTNLAQVGLGYLDLNRSMNTLSGGEITRVRLASQLSARLSGIIYILDEPSVGLHPRDNQELIDTLKFLRDLGNTVIVVEHDEAMIAAADYIIDIGPGAGDYGGQVLFAGTLAKLKESKESITAQYLFGGEKITRKKKPLKDNKGEVLTIRGASTNNLKNIDVEIPLKKMVCVTGVSGSGKSTLVIDVLSKALAKYFYRAKEDPGAHKSIEGLSNIDKVISVDQSPIGRTPRSNPATYTGVFNLIRDLFASLPEARMRGYDAGKFSFNVKGGGRCEACAGDGYIRIPMQFLADVFVECAECNGLRYNHEALEVRYRDKHIADVLQMTVEEAFHFFVDLSNIADKLNILRQVGLGYIKLGQSATTLSGGEAQRIKLSMELARPSTGRTLYILDEPTTGLHFADISRLLQVLSQLVDKGNTVLVIEHNVDVIRSVDYIIELGPEGGAKGGEVIATGTPEELKKNKKSWTGKYL